MRDRDSEPPTLPRNRVYRCADRDIVVLALEGERQAFYKSESRCQWLPFDGLFKTRKGIGFHKDRFSGMHVMDPELDEYGTPQLKAVCQQLDALDLPTGEGIEVKPEFINQLIDTEQSKGFNKDWKIIRELERKDAFLDTAIPHRVALRAHIQLADMKAESEGRGVPFQSPYMPEVLLSAMLDEQVAMNQAVYPGIKSTSLQPHQIAALHREIVENPIPQKLQLMGDSIVAGKIWDTAYTAYVAATEASKAQAHASTDSRSNGSLLPMQCMTQVLQAHSAERRAEAYRRMLELQLQERQESKGKREALPPPAPISSRDLRTIGDRQEGHVM